jgi:hypothetical protein
MLEELVNVLEEFEQLLATHTKSFYLKGTRPSKQEIVKWK